VEQISKDWQSSVTKGYVMDIVRRDHPELPGIVTELKLTIQEMEEVNAIRKEAMSRRFDDAINDSTMFLDLLRTYGSVLSFYLHIKSRGRLQKKTYDIFTNVTIKTKSWNYAYNLSKCSDRDEKVAT